jgi:hypothetical protein
VNLAIEYLLRTGLLREFMDKSASIFLSGPKNHNLVVVVEKLDHKHIIRSWLVDDAVPQYALPPMTDYLSLEPFKDLSKLRTTYDMFKYQEENFPSRYSAPMDQRLYNEYLENILISKKHVEAKRRWLWKLFLSIYAPDVQKSITQYHFGYFSASSDLIMGRQQQVVQYDLPKIWKNWLMWQDFLLLPESVPGELIFASSFSDFS